MVDLDVIAAKLAELEHRIDRLRARQLTDEAALVTNEDLRDLLAFNLMVAVQASVDIATHLIADEQWAPSTTLGQAFTRLRENEVISAETERAMAQAAGLRNVVAHGYAGVEIHSLFLAATSGLTDLERFRQEVSVWLLSRASG